MLLSDPDRNVRSSAIDALGSLVQANPDLATATLRASLITMLSDRDLTIRSWASYALGRVVQANPALATPVNVALTKLLNDPDPDVRSSAAYAFGSVVQANPALATTTLAAALTTLLSNPDTFVRSSAASTLGRVVQANPALATTTLAAALTTLLSDQDSTVRYWAADALGSLVQANPSATTALSAALIKSLSDQDRDVRTATTTTLARVYAIQYSAPNQWDTLLLLLTDPIQPITRPVAARALFLIALNNPTDSARMRVLLNSPQYATSHEPIARIWANKTLALLDLADLASSGISDEKNHDSQMVIDKLSNYSSADFFGDDFIWAADEARTWVERR
jgi:vesicle coat complex subunit